MAMFAPVRASVDWLLDSACFGWLPCWPEPLEVLPELPGAAGCSLGFSDTPGLPGLPGALGLSPGVDGSVGLIVTIGIGSSFSTLPIITVIYVPLCMTLGFSPAATVAIVGTAGALGDAGSAASDSTLSPTIGLGADGQHDHIRDSVIPTFLHFNIPLLIAGWVAAMIL